MPLRYMFLSSRLMLTIGGVAAGGGIWIPGVEFGDKDDVMVLVSVPE